MGSSGPDEAAIRAAAEREAMARLAEAEQRASSGQSPGEPPETAAEPSDASSGPFASVADPPASVGGERGRVIDSTLEEARGVRQPEDKPADIEPGPSQADGPADPDEMLRSAEEVLAKREQRFESAIEYAKRRLGEAERRAGEAEARADRLAALRERETERADELRQVLEQIQAAEKRAADADERVRELVDASSSAPEAEELLGTEAVGLDDPALAEDPTPPGPEDAPAPFPNASPLSLAPPLDGVGSGPASSAGDERVDVNLATSEDLRSLGVGVIETGRILAERERCGGFESLEQLDAIGGISPELVAKLKTSLRV